MFNLTNLVPQFFHLFQAAAGGPSNALVTLLVAALLLTVIVVGVQQYQIAQLHKAVLAATFYLEQATDANKAEKSAEAQVKATVPTKA